MGSNMAECHPVGFQWVMKAKERGAKIIHIDPRFTRTSAVADLHVPLRAGSDIAFLGGIVNYILGNDRDFREYVVEYTNAPTIINGDFRDTEDLDGLFSGWDPEARTYDTGTWQYEGMSASSAAGQRSAAAPPGSSQRHGSHGGLIGGHAPHVDRTLQDPRCVYQILKRHFSRYTPEVVGRTCGVPEALFLEVCEALCANSGRDRTSAFCYAVGWTQHTVGVQYIRTASIIQLLLGNIGRPGGGILALRGHASIQGSTDVPTLYDLLPGYLPMPQATEPAKDTLDDYVTDHSSPTGFWGHMDAYTVSFLKAWFGDEATADNDYCFDLLPRIDGDHSTYQTLLGMLDGQVKGYFLLGENPTVGNANGGMHRRALAALDWLVVRDMFEIESASFWYDSPEIESGEVRSADIGTEVFFLPAASHVEKEGTFTNTQRLLQWRHKAVEAPQDCRSDLWFMYHLGRIIKERLATSTDGRDRPVQALTWDYPVDGPHADPSAEAVLQEINGRGPDGLLPGYTALKADGSTSCGCWIYSGCFADGVNQTARRTPAADQSWVAPDWGWAWPSNRRLLYNRASADRDGKPWSHRKAYVWWDEDQGKWVGHDVPDFEVTKRPDYEPGEGAEAEAALSGTSPFIMQADGAGWLFVPSGLVDGPLPTHYEPEESPIANPLYGQERNPVRQELQHRDNRYAPSTSEVYPFALTTYRLTEHHTAGGMSRTLPYLSELQPEMFCEVSPELAALRGLGNGGWATIVTARAAIEARVLVTDRLAPLCLGDKVIHQVGLPYHWGRMGLSTGDSANDLLHLALDPNVHIQEAKAVTCDIVVGRRPRGRALASFVEGFRDRAGMGNMA
jgi:formate dehydrogenase major subunit